MWAVKFGVTFIATYIFKHLLHIHSEHIMISLMDNFLFIRVRVRTHHLCSPHAHASSSYTGIALFLRFIRSLEFTNCTHISLFTYVCSYVEAL